MTRVRHARRYVRMLPLGGRVLWTTLDQGVSSLTNLGLSVAVARASDAEAFGTFALAFAIYTLALGLGRALATGPLAIRHSAGDYRTWRAATKAAAGSSLGIGLILSVAILGLSVATTSPLTRNLIALAITLPMLLLQDAWRFGFFSAAKPASALLNDVIWGGTFLVIMLVLDQRSVQPSSHVSLLAWGASAGIAALIGGLQARIVPTPGSTRQWLRDQKDMWPSLLGDFLVRTGVGQLMVFGTAIIAGVGASGAIRGVQVAFGPVNVLLMASVALLIPEGARALNRSTTLLISVVRVATGALIGATVLWAILMRLLPFETGEALLGESWAPARTLLLSYSLVLVSSALSTGANVGLRVLEEPRRAFKIRSITAPFILSCGLVGAWADGAQGALIGQAIPGMLGCIIWWRQFGDASRSVRSPEPLLINREGPTSP